MRSNSGPEIRFWYFVMAAGAQAVSPRRARGPNGVHGLIGSPYQPQGQGWTQSDRFFLLNNR